MNGSPHHTYPLFVFQALPSHQHQSSLYQQFLFLRLSHGQFSLLNYFISRLILRASMSAAALSLLPSSSPHLLFPPSSSSSSSTSSFVLGGTHLRTHKSFVSLHSWSPSSSSSNTSSWKFNTKRRVGIVFAASGDYYATLGVPKSASSKEIKTAYRRLARQVLIFTPFWKRKLIRKL